MSSSKSGILFFSGKDEQTLHTCEEFSQGQEIANTCIHEYMYKRTKGAPDSRVSLLRSNLGAFFGFSLRVVSQPSLDTKKKVFHSRREERESKTNLDFLSQGLNSQ